MMSERQTDVLDEVRKRALAELNIKVSREDPVFSVVFATEAVLERMTEPLVLAVKQIPGEMGISIEKIASAVEDAEQTVERLVEEGKTALAEVRDTEAKKLVKVVRESLEEQRRQPYQVLYRDGPVFLLCFNHIGGWWVLILRGERCDEGRQLLVHPI